MAAEGEKKGAMEAEGEKKGAMAGEKGTPVKEKGKGEDGAVASEEGKGEAATEKGEAVAEAKEVAGVKMIALRSADKAERSMSVAAAEVSETLRNMIEDGCANEVIPLENAATGRTLDTVIEYCTKHAAEIVKSDSDPSTAPATKSDSNPSAEAGSSGGGGGVNTAVSENLEDWDRKLVDRLSMDDLHDVLHAANHLEIEGLLDVIYQKVADMIKGKTTNEIRATFNIANDFNPEEEAELRQQYAWIFDE